MLYVWKPHYGRIMFVCWGLKVKSLFVFVSFSESCCITVVIAILNKLLYFVCIHDNLWRMFGWSLFFVVMVWLFIIITSATHGINPMIYKSKCSYYYPWHLITISYPQHTWKNPQYISQPRVPHLCHLAWELERRLDEKDPTAWQRSWRKKMK